RTEVDQGGRVVRTQYGRELGRKYERRSLEAVVGTATVNATRVSNVTLTSGVKNLRIVRGVIPVVRGMSGDA
ncbi:hypothetical protein A2U01_0077961, partial [Trifolium medium]|nr:hypothetical protein [Trifolium medium]